MLSEVYICSLIQRRQALLRDGPVAQLNRASDYGSEGFRFESWRGHTENQALTSKDVGAFFIICIQFAYKIGPKRWNESANDGKQAGLWPVQLGHDFGFVVFVWVVVLAPFGTHRLIEIVRFSTLAAPKSAVCPVNCLYRSVPNCTKTLIFRVLKTKTYQHFPLFTAQYAALRRR